MNWRQFFKNHFAKKIKTGYCEIAAVVDKKYADNINTDIVMIGIDRLKEVTFDKIIIALKKDGERKAVKKQLISMGIENDKIYSEDPIGYSSVCHYKLDENLESLSDIVYDISTNWDMDIRYCEPVISDIKRYNESIDMMARFKRYIREEKTRQTLCRLRATGLSEVDSNTDNENAKREIAEL